MCNINILDRIHRPSTACTRGLFTAAAGPLLLLMLCAGCAVPQPRGGGRLEHLIEPTTGRGYWLYLPKAYVQTDQQQRGERRWPLVVSFHGMKPFDSSRPQALEWQQEADRFGYVVIAPELRAFHMFGQFPLKRINSAFSSDEKAALAVLDHVLKTTRADPENVLSTSWSSGGYIAHYMLNRYPEKFTALAVRQSNFTASVLNPEITRRSRYHPILILNTQNDFAICKRESREAIDWYETHGYENIYWIHIKDKGHERTPDLAADFFGRVAGVQPSSPLAVLVQRQAIDGNEQGIAFFSGAATTFATAPAAYASTHARRLASGSRPPMTHPRAATPRPSANTRASDRNAAPPPTVAVPRRDLPRTLLKIRVSSAIGIEPLHLGFSAECPANWRRTASFRWTLNGQPIGTDVNGQKTIANAGEHTLGLNVVTSNGRTYKASRTIRVLPRLDEISSSAGGGR